MKAKSTPSRGPATAIRSLLCAYGWVSQTSLVRQRCLWMKNTSSIQKMGRRKKWRCGTPTPVTLSQRRYPFFQVNLFRFLLLLCIANVCYGFSLRFYCFRCKGEGHLMLGGGSLAFKVAARDSQWVDMNGEQRLWDVNIGHCWLLGSEDVTRYKWWSTRRHLPSIFALQLMRLSKLTVFFA